MSDDTRDTLKCVGFVLGWFLAWVLYRMVLFNYFCGYGPSDCYKAWFT